MSNNLKLVRYALGAESVCGQGLLIAFYDSEAVGLRAHPNIPLLVANAAIVDIF